MKSVDALEVLENLGSAQWGLVTTAQAARLGVSRVALGRLSEKGRIHRMRHGVYALPSAGFDALQDLRAAWLATDMARDVDERALDESDVVVSHFSAAVVHGLGDVVAAKHEFTDAERRQTSQVDLRFHKGKLTSQDRVLVEGLPVTSVARTIADLAGARVDVDHLAPMVRDALQLSPGIYERLGDKLSPYASRYGYRDGESVVAACLNQAGLPETAADVLRHSPEVFSRALSGYLQTAIQPAVSEALRSVAHGLPTTVISEELQRELTASTRHAFQTVDPDMARHILAATARGGSPVGEPCDVTGGAEHEEKALRTAGGR